MWLLALRSLHELFEEITFGPKMDATSMRRIPGIKQCEPIMVFL